MSGHSKWSTIKHKKAAADAQRGRLFSKLIREITIAARVGGGDPNGNPRLRTAIANAQEINMPKDNITRAIKKGTGELPGESYEDFTFEGYGPAGVAIMVEGSTDNRNRTVAEIRHVFDRNGGKMGEAGCVSWMFEKRGMIVLDSPTASPDELLEIALEAGAEDIKTEDDTVEIYTDPASFEDVKEKLLARGFKTSMAEVSLIPKSTVQVEDEADAKKILRLMESLEEQDDVRKVSANFDIPDTILEAAG